MRRTSLSPLSYKDKVNLLFMNYQRGTTILEMLLYIGIAASIIGILSGLVGLVYQTSIKNQVAYEVEMQGRRALDVMSQELRGAKEVTSPLSGSGAMAGITFLRKDPDGEEVTLYANNGILYMQEGMATPNAITNDLITVSNVLFTNIKRPNTADMIQMVVILTNNSASLRQEYVFAKTFTTTVTIRN